MSRSYTVLLVLVGYGAYAQMTQPTGNKRQAENIIHYADSTPGNAQYQKVSEDLKNTGDSIPNVSIEKIEDQVLSGKMGPGGESIYIDKHDKYYYVNDEGYKVYISKMELKDNPGNNRKDDKE